MLMLGMAIASLSQLFIQNYRACREPTLKNVGLKQVRFVSRAMGIETNIFLSGL